MRRAISPADDISPRQLSLDLRVECVETGLCSQASHERLWMLQNSVRANSP